MIVLETIAVAFSMFSGIPMPQFEWNAKNMRYTMLAFPFVGAVIGGLEGLLFWGAYKLEWNDLLLWVCGILIPVFVTGGIHLDGFCDTCDALGSHASKEKKLEILKDSHSGAFALIGLGCFFLLAVGIFSKWQYQGEVLLCAVTAPILSRALSGLAVVLFPCAKNSGLLHTFQDHAARKKTGCFLGLLIVLLWAFCILVHPFTGFFMIVTSCLLFGGYNLFSKKLFGGITGDLAGYFLCICELVFLAVFVLSSRV